MNSYEAAYDEGNTDSCGLYMHEHSQPIALLQLPLGVESGKCACSQRQMVACGRRNAVAFIFKDKI
jgi:hypothetical protein